MCKELPRSILFAGVLALASVANAWADYEKGLAAYERGDYAIAFKEWKVTAEQGDPKSQYNLALMYDNGDGVMRNNAEAVKWYRKLAEQGLAAGQNGLGTMYTEGRGVPKDDREAAKLYYQAATQGLHDAIFNLALAYEKGRGVPRSYNIAAITYLEAAKRGYAPAQANVGLLYAKGVPGVPLNNALAYKWISLAIPNLTGETKTRMTKSRDAIAARLTPAERDEMDKVIGEWKPETKPTSNAPELKAPSEATTSTVPAR